MCCRLRVRAFDVFALGTAIYQPLNIICNFGVENITFKYNYVEQINNNVEKILRKSDIEFIDLKKYNKEMLESTLQKALKFDSFQPGRNYYKIF